MTTCFNTYFWLLVILKIRDFCVLVKCLFRHSAYLSFGACVFLYICIWILHNRNITLCYICYIYPSYIHFLILFLLCINFIFFSGQINLFFIVLKFRKSFFNRVDCTMCHFLPPEIPLQRNKSDINPHEKNRGRF